MADRVGGEAGTPGPGLALVNTGNGKGKTTAALGVAMRAWGQGLRVIMYQFIKTSTSNYGENRAARRMGFEMIPLGDGFTWMSRDIDRTRALNLEGWERASATILGGAHDLVVLDELTYLFKYGWLDVEEALDVLRRRPPAQHVIITGRDAPPALLEFADLVTEMREVKHPFKQGIRAQRGIEF